MLNRLTGLLVCAAIVALLWPAASARAEEKLQPGKDFIWVVRDGGAGGYEAFPDVARLDDGRLMVVFYDGYSHVSLANEVHPKGGRISYVLSDDEGATWSQPRVLVDGPDDDRDPSIAQLSDGRLLCNYFEYPSGDIYVVYSSDAGKTWTQKQYVYERYGTSSPVCELKSGRLILPSYYSVAISDDKGASWRFTEIASAMPDAVGVSLTEAEVVQLDNGDLLAVHRSDGGTPMYSQVSVNDGETWGKASPMPYPGHSPYLMLTDDNILLLGYRGVIGKEEGWDTRLCYSLDDGKTWSKEILVDNVVGAYPSMVPLKDGSVLIVYYEEGSGSSIRARKFRADRDGIQWLTYE